MCAVEYGLMSTTTEKLTACEYSGVAKERGTVFEISAGRIDVGASISFLSQYPGEAEFLMPPLCCLEVFYSCPACDNVEAKHSNARYVCLNSLIFQFCAGLGVFE